MMAPPFKDHFSAVSDNYAAYRPTYPRALIDELVRLSPGRARALDCGCGTGQLSVLLAERFDDVAATDASTTQIEKAQPCERVSYRVARAEACGLPDACVDLITVAQAAHWFDLEAFYREVRRVARPNAVIALITYGVLHVEGAANSIVQHFYHDTLGPYWPAERHHVEAGYRDLSFPFTEKQLPTLAIEVSWTLQELVGYISTWSAVKAIEQARGAEPFSDFLDALISAWGDAGVRRQVRWPLSFRVGIV